MGPNPKALVVSLSLINLDGGTQVPDLTSSRSRSGVASAMDGTQAFHQKAPQLPVALATAPGAAPVLGHDGHSVPCTKGFVFCSSWFTFAWKVVMVGSLMLIVGKW